MERENLLLLFAYMGNQRVLNAYPLFLARLYRLGVLSFVLLNLSLPPVQVCFCHDRL